MLCTPGLSRLSSDSCEKMSRAWLINSRGIAKKVRNATQSAAYQVKDYGAKRECPNCHYLINNTDDSAEWPGLPGGVKFDPSDAELLDHLAAKCGVENSKPHLFIDEFIPTLDTDQGICYTHPENLPGITKDGNGVHFFHKTSNAYATGQRKRRKIQRHYSFAEDVRWHKTGKTKAVMENGVQKGCKKIMVLYKTAKKGTKPDKTNWVMHQYHLGTEHEKEGEYVVSKVLYQQRKQFEKNDNNIEIESSEVKKIETSPRTPKADPPPPPRPRKSEHSKGKGVFQPILQEEDFASELYRAGPSSFSFEANTDCTYRAGPSSFSFEANTDCTPWLAGESQAIENCDVNSLEYNDLLCEEIFDSRTLGNDLKLDQIDENQNKGTEQSNVSCGIADLDNIDLDTPPDFQLADLQFGSQDSIFSWLDKI